jgi:ADP-ribosylglycohydrolase
MSNVNLDRCAGVLLGLAAGDALGAGYEFASPPIGEATMKGGGLGGWEAGEWTDDSQMAICIAVETATGKVEPRAIAERFLGWYRSGPSDVGIQTRSVLSRSSAADEVGRRAAEYFTSHPDRSAGNGSLMRTAPLALACLGDDERLVELAMSVSTLTHADPVAGEACALWCIAIDRAIRHETLYGVRDGIELLPVDRRSYWEARLEEGEAGPPSRFAPNGFVVSALQAALAAIWHTSIPSGDEPCLHLQHALRAAVRIGDDTDTVAAIAGSLLGARWGASAVPVEWRAMLHGKPGIYGQPDYTSRDLVRLAVMSARHGEPQSIGWPDADDLMPYYVAKWSVPPVDQPLAEDPGILLGNVFGAAAASADVTVSLCRMGRTQLDGPDHPMRVELGLEDGGRSSNANLEFTFHDLARTMVQWRSAGKTVLVHCVRAERRTPAVGAAYLAEKTGLSGGEALRRVCAQLPMATVNPAFEEALNRVWPGSPS